MTRVGLTDSSASRSKICPSDRALTRRCRSSTSASRPSVSRATSRVPSLSHGTTSTSYPRAWTQGAVLLLELLHRRGGRVAGWRLCEPQGESDLTRGAWSNRGDRRGSQPAAAHLRARRPTRFSTCSAYQTQLANAHRWWILSAPGPNTAVAAAHAWLGGFPECTHRGVSTRLAGSRPAHTTGRTGGSHGQDRTGRDERRS